MMANKEVVEWIKSQKAKGYTDGFLQNYLVLKGYNINEVIESIKLANSDFLSANQMNTSFQNSIQENPAMVKSSSDSIVRVESPAIEMKKNLTPTQSRDAYNPNRNFKNESDYSDKKGNKKPWLIVFGIIAAILILLFIFAGLYFIIKNLSDEGSNWDFIEQLAGGSENGDNGGNTDGGAGGGTGSGGTGGRGGGGGGGSITGDSINCGTSGIIGEGTEAKTDSSMICLGESLLNGCQNSNALLSMEDAGTFDFLIINEGGDCYVQINLFDAEKITDLSLDSYVNKNIKCPVNLDEIKWQFGEAPLSDPGEFALMVYFYARIEMAKEDTSCVVSDMDKKYSSCIGKEYYVSSSQGEDSNSGTSINFPWKTIEKVNSFEFSPGDCILFKRGDEWRPAGSLFVQGGTDNLPIYYGAYGDDTLPKPLFLGSIKIDNSDDWAEVETNIWKTHPGEDSDEYKNSHIGIGNIIFNGEEDVGKQVINLTELNNQGEFYFQSPLCYKTGGCKKISNTRDLYVYSIINPTNYYSDMEFVFLENVISIANVSGVMIENFEIKYASGMGIIGGKNISYITIRDCDFSYIGGRFQNAISSSGKNFYNNSPYVALGNGIQFSHNANDILVDGCTFNQIYDDAMTYQSWNPNEHANEISFTNNVVMNTEYCYALWSKFESSSIKDVSFKNNLCINNGYGWAHYQRGADTGKGFNLGQTASKNTDLQISNNLIFNSNNFITLRDWTGEYPEINSNCYLNFTRRNDQPAFWVVNTTHSGWYISDEKFLQYQKDTGFDLNSIYIKNEITRKIIGQNLKFNNGMCGYFESDSGEGIWQKEKLRWVESDCGEAVLIDEFCE